MFSIVIINWNSFEDTVECINSLLSDTSLITKILVVDNASTDDSYARLERFSQIVDNEFVELIKSDTNTGYCGGNNLGFSRCMKNSSDYILVLNNDVKITKGTLFHLNEAFENDTQIAILSPMVNGEMIFNAPFLKKAANSLGLRFDSSDTINKLTLKYYVPGCAIAFKKEFIKNCGGFESQYFMYVEEIEIAFRAWRKGYKVGQINIFDSNVERKKDEVEKLKKAYVWYYQTRNMLYFLDKTFSENRILRIVVKMKYLMYSILRPIKQKKIYNIIPITQGIMDYFYGKTGKYER